MKDKVWRVLHPKQAKELDEAAIFYSESIKNSLQHYRKGPDAFRIYQDAIDQALESYSVLNKDDSPGLRYRLRRAYIIGHKGLAEDYLDETIRLALALKE